MLETCIQQSHAQSTMLTCAAHWPSRRTWALPLTGAGSALEECCPCRSASPAGGVHNRAFHHRAAPALQPQFFLSARAGLARPEMAPGLAGWLTRQERRRDRMAPSAAPSFDHEARLCGSLLHCTLIPPNVTGLTALHPIASLPLGPVTCRTRRRF